MKRYTRSIGLAITALALVAAACSSDSSSSSTAGTTGSEAPQLSGELNGAGSSAQQAAQEAWIADFTADQPDLTINYDPSGSGAGVEQFTSGGVPFAGSDAYMTGDSLTAANTQCGGEDSVIELPVYISPIAIAFNVPDVTSLNMTPDVVAKIFSGQITKWNDQAITSQNSGVNLPDLAISPVHRSDDSGTTFNFTDYLSQAAPSVWTDPAGETWPIKSGEAGGRHLRCRRRGQERVGDHRVRRREPGRQPRNRQGPGERRVRRGSPSEAAVRDRRSGDAGLRPRHLRLSPTTSTAHPAVRLPGRAAVVRAGLHDLSGRLDGVRP